MIGSRKTDVAGSNNRESLRAQLIEAMTGRLGPQLAESVFTHDLWPVLDAAMTAGELLVDRNTVAPKPIDEAIVDWLKESLGIIKNVHQFEGYISKKRALKLLFQLEASAYVALRDAEAVNEKGARKSALLSAAIKQN